MTNKKELNEEELEDVTGGNSHDAHISLPNYGVAYYTDPLKEEELPGFIGRGVVAFQDSPRKFACCGVLKKVETESSSCSNDVVVKIELDPSKNNDPSCYEIAEDGFAKLCYDDCLIYERC